MLRNAESRAGDASLQNVALRGSPIEVRRIPRVAGSAASEHDWTAQPRTADEVEALVKWAAAQGVSLGVTSSAAHPARRASDPVMLQIDLGRMRRLFHVDAGDAVAIIEPGLSFAELDRLLAPQRLRSFKPLLPRAGKSAIASYLEREPLLMVREQWDVLDPFGAAEIVFGSGERFHTGAAGNPGKMDDHWKAGMRYMTATGPVGTDFMRVLQGSQGTLGIVTWAAIFCDRLPLAEESFFVTAQTAEPLLDLSAELNYRRLGHSLFLSSRAHLAMLARAVGIAVEEAKFPAWALLVNIAAAADLPEDRLAYEAADTRALVQAAGLAIAPAVAGLSAQAIVNRQASLADGDYRDVAGKHRSVFFLTQGDRVPAFVKLAEGLATKHGVATTDIAVYVQPRLQGRNCHLEFVIPGNAPRADALAAELAQACCDKGGFFSRPYGAWTEMAYARNPKIVPFLRHCKSMFDPKGILQPGRLGL